jgi:hypothetical protein
MIHFSRMNTTHGAQTSDPGGTPEIFPVCRPEREDSIVPLLVVGAVALLIQRVRRWLSRRCTKRGGASCRMG